jgi:hypothetical protein
MAPFSVCVQVAVLRPAPVSLLNWPVEKQDPIVSQGVQTGLRRYSKMRLTDFGNVFVEACIPENGFEKFAKNV